LPHAHILLILNEQDKPKTNADYDRIVSAEIPDPKLHPLAYETITKHNIHGPCGLMNKSAVCMLNDKNICSKYYPKPFQSITHEDDNGYPVYRRRNDNRTVQIGKYSVDNRWIIPHNLYLSTKFDCHINVEICSTIRAIKYLYKYVYKGHDKIMHEIQSDKIKGKYRQLLLLFYSIFIS